MKTSHGGDPISAAADPILFSSSSLRALCRTKISHDSGTLPHLAESREANAPVWDKKFYGQAEAKPLSGQMRCDLIKDREWRVA